MSQLPEPQSRRHVIAMDQVPIVYEGWKVSGPLAHWPRQAIAESGARSTRAGSLLVALDGSMASEHALPYALAIARRSGAPIRLVHVHSLMDSVSAWHQYYSDRLQNRLRRQKQAYLQSILRRIRRWADVQATAVVVESDDTAQSLREAAAGAALMVLATQERGVLGRLFHAHVTTTLMRTSLCPLLLVRGSRSAVDWASDPLPRHVLLPLDGTQSAETALHGVSAMNWLSQAQFTLVHFENLDEADDVERVDPAGFLLDEAQHRHPRVVTSDIVMSNHRTPTAILSYAEEQEVDLIALTTRGRRALARWLKPSVTEAVVKRAKMPVLVFPATALRGKPT